jgi:hypothetical protein
MMMIIIIKPTLHLANSSHCGVRRKKDLYTGIIPLNRVNLNHNPPCSGPVLVKQMRVAEERGDPPTVSHNTHDIHCSPVESGVAWGE